jgi:hypothetical protein
MAENTNTDTIFSKKLVDITGLESFWGKVKAYIDNAKGEAINTVVGKSDDADTANTVYGAKAYTDSKIETVNGTISGISQTVAGHTETIGTLQATVNGLVGGEGVAGGIDGMINSKIETFETNKITPLTNRVGTLETGLDNLTKSVPTDISTAIKGLNNSDNVIDNNKFVTGVTVSDAGKLVLTYGERKDWTDEIATAESNAKSYTDTELITHIATTSSHKVGDEEKGGLIHISGADRYKWDTAATRIDTFLTSTTESGVIDNLTEINKWFSGHEGEYGALLANVQQNNTTIANHTTAINDNATAINTLNTNLATIKIASVKECEDIVK